MVIGGIGMAVIVDTFRDSYREGENDLVIPFKLILGDWAWFAIKTAMTYYFWTFVFFLLPALVQSWFLYIASILISACTKNVKINPDRWTKAHAKRRLDLGF